MNWGKDNKKNKRKYVVDVKRRYDVIEVITIKVSKNFMKLLEGTIEHIKRNKKIYRVFVVYTAFLMFSYTIPDIIQIIEEFDYIAFIDKIQSTPKNILISSILQILRSIACCISMTLCLIYYLKNLFKPNDF